MKLRKRIAALGMAAMMLTSFSVINASAADDGSFSLYISSQSSVTSQTVSPGRAAQDGYVSITYKINKINAKSVKYHVVVGGKLPSNNDDTLSTTGSHTVKHSHSDIEKNNRIIITMKLNPKSSAIGNYASGQVFGS